MLDDPSIYDDPNVLVGDKPISTNNDRQIKNNRDEPDLNYAPIALRNIFQNLPKDNQPGDDWRKELQKWGRSDFSRWIYDLKYITNNLTTEDVLNLYRKLPTIILGSPKTGSKKYQVFKHYQRYFDATSAWMRYLAYSDVERPLYLTKKPYITYEKDALVLNNELNLCKIFLLHDSAKVNHIFFKKPIVLWLLIQYAEAMKQFKSAGLLKPLSINDLKTKDDIYKESRNYIKPLLDSELDLENLKSKNSIIIKNTKDLFYNLPDFVVWRCKRMAEQDKEKNHVKNHESSPFFFFNKYVKSLKTIQNLNRNGSQNRHAIHLYNSEKSTKIYITKSKRPSLKPSKRKYRKAKHGFSNC